VDEDELMLLQGWKRGVREQLLRFRMEHISGPRSVILASDEAAVTCVLRNAEFYVDAFVQHYSSLGFRHIFFLDNGSTDSTIDLVRRHENVSVYRSHVPIGTYQAMLKKHLASVAVPVGWCLDVDVDEFFEYPGSKVLSLAGFLQYLNDGDYSAVLTQMLDMFSDRPLAALAERQPPENLREVYRFYDISRVTTQDYRTADLVRRYASGNSLPSEEVRLCFGGIRRALWNLNCLLTKHSLVRMGRNVELFPHVHFVNRARLADVSAILLHYKLVSNAYQAAAQNRGAFHGISKGYDDLMRLIEAQPQMKIRSESAVELGEVVDLADEGFIFLSSAYRERVRNAMKTCHSIGR
jgi:hypothetical protein